MDNSTAANTKAAQSSATGIQAELEKLEARINQILPPRYVGCFEDVPANSMGSAALKYDQEGKVAWGAIWTTFCHLALAGGPPHRGRFLGAVPAKDALASPDEQSAVVAEIKRAIHLSAVLRTVDENRPGWVGVRCDDTDMAAWLVRAIVAENVIARHEGDILYVPAGPHFRIEKEVKNVVVCVAKTSHYLLDHVDEDARPRGLSVELIQPPLPEEIAEATTELQSATADLRERLQARGLTAIESECPGWIGIQCSSEEHAIWIERAVIVENVLARREADVLYVPIPIGQQSAQARDRIAGVVGDAMRLWQGRAELNHRQ